MNVKVFGLLLVMFNLPFHISVSAANTAEPVNVIHSYFEDLNEKQWDNAISWWVEESREDLLDFIANKENQLHKRGLLNTKAVELVMWKELPYEYGEQFLPNRYMEKFQDPKVYYIGANYKVYSQNEYLINGMNYFLLAMVLENGNWKIASISHVPVRSLISDGYGFGTRDEKTYDERRIQFKEKQSAQ